MIRKLILLLIISLPTFGLMLRHGIYTMHYFHPFRLFEFDKCIQELVFPCRWAPDAGMGYGEPLFNFYGQFPYWLGELIHLAGFSLVDSIKLLFILTIVVSGVAMYRVSTHYWGQLGGFVSAVLYMYAPYRSVDVWVRGALNESLAFVFYPLILYNFDQYLDKRHSKHLLWLVVFSTMLITTHNLSVLMFAPFLVLWWLIKIVRQRTIRNLPGLLIGGLLTLTLSAYYLLPVIFESSLVTLSKTTQGYYDYRAHFATLTQLFLSRFWGYGASLWGPVDDLSFSIGHIQWIVVAVLGLWGVFSRIAKNQKSFLHTCWVWANSRFITHNKSQFIWQVVSPMAYIQFPWRFLSVAIFFLALAWGAVGQVTRKRLYIVIAIIVITVISNITFFRPDIWREVNDQQQYSGKLWDEQRSSALQDFWPATAADQPVAFAPEVPNATIKSSSADFSVETLGGQVSFPIVFFPGWKASVNGQPVDIGPSGKLGLITADLPSGVHSVRLIFGNTWPRTAGNLISGLSLAILVAWYLKVRGWHSS